MLLACAIHHLKAHCGDFSLKIVVVASSIAKLPEDAFVLAVTADACSMVNVVCLFMKPHVLVLL